MSGHAVQRTASSLAYPAIHVSLARRKDVDARLKAGHDENREIRAGVLKRRRRIGKAARLGDNSACEQARPKTDVKTASRRTS